MTAPLLLEEKLLLFRQAFDQAFAAAPVTGVETFEDLLAVRVAGDPYALRIRETKGLVASRKIVPLPSKRPELLGVAGNRGALVPVYSLAALLGYGIDARPISWLALAGVSEPIALGFEELEGFVRVRAGDVHAVHRPEGKRAHVGDVALVGNQSRRIVDIPSMLATLAVQAGVAGPPKES